MYSNNQLVGQRIADTAIPAFTIVKEGTSDGYATAAVGATAHMIGIAPNYAIAAGAVFSFTFGGVAQVLCEQSVTKGDMITAGTTSGAITLTNAGTVHVHSVGVAIRGASAGDIFPIQVIPQDTLV